MQLPPPGGHGVRLDGERYQVASAAADHGWSRPCPRPRPTRPCTCSDAMLIVCAIALFPPPWPPGSSPGAREPLSQIAHRASRVTAGDLSVRMGPVGRMTRSPRSRSPSTPCSTGSRPRSPRSAGSCTTRHTSCGRRSRSPAVTSRSRCRPRPIRSCEPPWGGDRRARSYGQAGGQPAPPRPRRITERPLMTPVDVGDLARAVIDRSRVLGDRDWLVRADGAALVDGDADALEQVILNLVVNAVRHTARGDAIEVRSATNAASVAIEVARQWRGDRPQHSATAVRPIHARGQRTRPRHGRGRAGSGDLPRDRRGARRHDRGRKHAGARGQVHHRPATVGRGNSALDEA